jgi:hypothetical protein
LFFSSEEALDLDLTEKTLHNPLKPGYVPQTPLKIPKKWVEMPSNPLFPALISHLLELTLVVT